jgi:hypothetical protein
MKKLLLLAVSAVLLGIPGWAAPCAPGTLASYMALGSAGCELGNLQVTNFKYHAKAAGGAAEITADQVMVTPLLAPTGTYGLQFAAPWTVEAGQREGSNVIYHVVSQNPSIKVEQIRLDGAGFQAGPEGSVEVNETLATPVSTRDLQVYLKCTDTCRSQTSDQLAIASTAAALTVGDQVTLHSKQGTASMTGFTDWFVVCAACA